MRTQFIVIQTLAALTLAFLASGCGKGTPSFSMLPAGQTFHQNSAVFNNKLDILWVIDNSGSMSPSQTNLVNNFKSFIQNFQTLGYDFQMAVTTSDAYKADPSLSGYSSANSGLGKFRDGSGSTHTGVFVINQNTPNLNNVFVTNATQGASGDGDERAFSSFRWALKSPLNTTFNFLRPTSFFAVIILSDEDDFSDMTRCADCSTDHNYADANLETVSSYVSWLDTLTNSTGVSRRYNVNAITVLDNTCKQQLLNNGSSTSIIGQRYIQLAQATSGVTGSICDASYANDLDAIQSQIATLSTQFPLDRVPQVNTIVVVVNGVTIPQDPTNGWTYNSSNNSIMFHGSAVPAQNATIQINFTPATITN
jgi:hypothetical protein